MTSLIKKKWLRKITKTKQKGEMSTVSYCGDKYQNLLWTYNMQVLNSYYDYEGLMSLLYFRS